MKLKRAFLIILSSVLLLTASATASLAWNENTDIFDWGPASAATKEEIVSELQEILIKKNLLDKRYTAEQLVTMVEKQLAIDNEQAIIIEKMCEGLKLNCDSLWQ